MKKILCILLLSAAFITASAQTQDKYFYGDSLYFLKNGGNAELILKNGSRATKGFLYNIGDGRTIFKEACLKLNDSTYVIGADTLRIKATGVSKTYIDSALATKQNSLGFTPENSANKATDLSSNDNTHYPTTAATKTAIDGKVVDSINDGVTTSAPSQNAVFDALAGKEQTITTLPINKGGTGQSSANAALNALLPSQSGNNGKVLKTDGSNAAWQTDGSGSSLSPEMLGVIYNNSSFVASDTNVFLKPNGTALTIGSGKLSFSGGTNTSNKTLDYYMPHDLEKFKIVIAVTPTEKTATSHGPGLGINSSINRLIVKFDATTGGNSGKVLILNIDSVIVAQSAAISFSAHDRLIFVVERDIDVVRGTIRNVTTGTAAQSATFTSFNLATPNSSVVFNSIGKFSIFNFGGTFDIDSLNISSKELKYANLMVVGDSKSQGRDASSYFLSYARKLNHIYPNTIVYAGSNNTIAAMLNCTDNIISLAPKQILLNLGCNDVRAGTPSGTYLANYDTLVNRFTAAGITVYHTLFPESSANQSTLLAHIKSTYPNNFIDCWNPLVNEGISVHPNDAQHEKIVHSIIESNKISGINFSQRNGAREFVFNDDFGIPQSSRSIRKDSTNNSIWIGDFLNIGVNSSGNATIAFGGNSIETTTGPYIRFGGGGMQINTQSGGSVLLREAGTTRATMSSGGAIGIGTTASAKIHALATTEQLRVGYDINHYLSGTVNSGGNMTLNLVASSGTPTLTISDPVSVGGNLTLNTAGNKLLITEGSNASVGTGTLSSGTVTINTTAVTANSRVFVTLTSCSSCGTVSIGAITPATSFVINSSSGSDASTFNWWIVN